MFAQITFANSGACTIEMHHIDVPKLKKKKEKGSKPNWTKSVVHVRGMLDNGSVTPDIAIGKCLLKLPEQILEHAPYRCITQMYLN